MSNIENFIAKKYKKIDEEKHPLEYSLNQLGKLTKTALSNKFYRPAKINGVNDYKNLKNHSSLQDYNALGKALAQSGIITGIYSLLDPFEEVKEVAEKVGIDKIKDLTLDSNSFMNDSYKLNSVLDFLLTDTRIGNVVMDLMHMDSVPVLSPENWQSVQDITVKIVGAALVCLGAYTSVKMKRETYAEDIAKYADRNLRLEESTNRAIHHYSNTKIDIYFRKGLSIVGDKIGDFTANIVFSALYGVKNKIDNQFVKMYEAVVSSDEQSLIKKIAKAVNLDDDKLTKRIKTITDFNYLKFQQMKEDQIINNPEFIKQTEDVVSISPNKIVNVAIEHTYRDLLKRNCKLSLELAIKTVVDHIADERNSDLESLKLNRKVKKALNVIEKTVKLHKNTGKVDFNEYYLLSKVAKTFSDDLKHGRILRNDNNQLKRPFNTVDFEKDYVKAIMETGKNNIRDQSKHNMMIGETKSFGELLKTNIDVQMEYLKKEAKLKDRLNIDKNRGEYR